jgi:hypothetical protein
MFLGLAPIPGNDSERRVYTRTFLLRLEEAIPGLGFRQAAESFDTIQETIDDLLTNHQALVDLLGERGIRLNYQFICARYPDVIVNSGFLNEDALTALQGAEFRQLDLGPTMHDENGLNLPRGNVMHGKYFSRHERNRVPALRSFQQAGMVQKPRLSFLRWRTVPGGLRSRPYPVSSTDRKACPCKHWHRERRVRSNASADMLGLR